MKPIRIIDVPAISSLDDPDHGWKYQAMERIFTTCWTSIYGNDDEAYTAQGLMVDRSNEVDFCHYWAIAIEGDDDPAQVVGLVLMTMHIKDNLDKAEFDIWVDPLRRREGIGSALLAWTEQVVRDAGRHVITTWAYYGRHEDQPPHLMSPDGTQIPAQSPGVDFLSHRGYSIVLVERRSQLDLPCDPALLDDLAATVPDTEDYRLHTWVSGIPHEWLDSCARLFQAFSPDAPTGEVDWQEEPWDSERVLRKYKELDDKNMVSLTTVAEHVGTGELAGITEYVWRIQPTKPAVEQWITEVSAAHRGHRLGMWMKLTNLNAMVSMRPDAERIYTSNAEENAPMLDINVAMGFYPSGGYVYWTKALT